MKHVKKIFRTFIPYIIVIGAIVVLAFVSQLWAEIKEEPTEVHYISSAR